MTPTSLRAGGARATLDVDAYLERIGLRGSPTLAEMHSAHVRSIVFENLDPHSGIPTSIDPDVVAEKMVTRHRGGFCFEHNALFGGVLGRLGYEPEVLLARVRVGAPPLERRPRSHSVLRVPGDDGPLLADVGFGTGGLLEPIPLEPGLETRQGDADFRLVEDGLEIVLQWRLAGGAWSDLYGFVPEAVPAIDVEMSNWYASTHPDSRFVRGLLVSVHEDDGARLVLSDWSGSLRLSKGGESSPVSWEQVPDQLAERFGLPGVGLSRLGPHRTRAPRLERTDGRVR